jgi:tetratricopeptide (TPR) repeat protein
VKGAEVQINRTDIKQQFKIKTDKNGKFNYATLPKGVFDVTITVDGKKILDQKGIPTDYAKPTVVDADMVKLAAAAQQAEALAQAQAAAPQGQIQVAAVQPQAQAAPDAPQMTPEQLKAALAEQEKRRKEFEDAQAKDKVLQDSFNAGIEAAKANNFAAAIDAFKKAAETDPKQHAVWGNLADTYGKKAATERGAERLADYNAAADAYMKAIEIAPEDPTYRFNASLMLARANKMDEAQAQLAKAAQIDPTQASRGWRNLGAVYFDTNRSEAAVGAYKKAIELDPKNADAHFQLGISLMQQATEKDGKLIAPAGTADALQEYLSLAPTGANAEEAKAMLQAMGETITNRVTRPGATPTKPAPAKGKGK